MNKIKIVTTGETFTDIDALACAIAYSELLTLEGDKTEIVLPGVFNSSITKTIREWDLKYKTVPKKIDSDVVIVDISNIKQVAKFVRLEQVTEVYDHHFGFQDFWKKRLKENAHIEHVGACATLIWEEFKKRGYKSRISKLSANLLCHAIVSNTLNFEAFVTDKRDKLAFKELRKYIDLPKEWIEQYLKEVEEGVFKNLKQAILNDTKVVDIPCMDFSIVMGQIELWDATEFFKYKKEAKEALEDFNYSHWFLNIPFISKKKSYIYTESKEVKELFLKIMPIKFKGDVGITDRLWLRKEIINKILEL